MHPIHYSLILNVLAMAVAAGLSFFLATPWPFVVILLLQNHMVGRFDNGPAPDDQDDGGYDGHRAGFLGKVD